MQILITEVTEMHSGNFCVAGWETQPGRMIRPLPNGMNWTAALLAQHGVIPGITIQVQPTGQAHPGQYPHTTEDTPVAAHSIRVISRGPILWAGPLAPPGSLNLMAAFGGALAHNSVWNGCLQGVHVPTGTQANSLVGIVIPRGNLGFLEEFGKLKAEVDDGINSHKLPVSSQRLKEAWRQGGINAVIATLPPTPTFHVRIGLARGFGASPDKCYAMLNGVN